MPLVISVDKKSQRMTVSADGATRYVWPVSTGRPGFDTPNGTFQPFRLDRDHHSTVYDNAPMPDSIFFTKTGDAVYGRSGYGPYGQSTYTPQPASIHYYGRAGNDVHATRQSPADGVARRDSTDEDGFGFDCWLKSFLTNVGGG
jgi:lipoprotein-anchoring transpeptidase ErfK/SrfK